MTTQTNNNRNFDDNQDTSDQQRPSADTSTEAQKSGAIDSDVNTSQPTSKTGKSLTNDEDANVDPNRVSDKPSFKK